MRVHYIKVEHLRKTDKSPRDTLGGSPIMPKGQEWPHCRLCKSRMIFFFQLDLQKQFDLPLKSGSHLLVFMCPVHNDMPLQMVEHPDVQLPEEYWNKAFGHSCLILNKPSKDEQHLEMEPHLSPRKLAFRGDEEEIDWDGHMERGTGGFKVGGVPQWIGEAEPTRCSCGSEMVFICQLPSDFPFPRSEEMPVQPNAVASENYSLFLGKPTFLFGCKQQCTPYSLYAVSQEPSGELAESA